MYILCAYPHALRTLHINTGGLCFFKLPIHIGQLEIFLTKAFRARINELNAYIFLAGISRCRN